jgi:hypothetical protein
VNRETLPPEAKIVLTAAELAAGGVGSRRRAGARMSATERPASTVVGSLGNAETTIVARAAASKGTGTVWDAIKVTQAAKPGAVVPHSFELRTSAGEFWVHPNATKHMNEYLLRNGSFDVTPMAIQGMLTSLQSAVDAAATQGVKRREKMNFGGWELMFDQRAGDSLPVLMHAVYR